MLKEEMFCAVCGQSSMYDSCFHSKQMLCNRHYLQMRRHGKILSVESMRNELHNKCEYCGTEDAKSYVRCNIPGEWYGKELCSYHNTQLKNNGKFLDKIKYKRNFESKAWTEDDEKRLEEMYRDGYDFESISKELNRTVSSISSKSSDLGLGEKYMRTNNPNYKADYQDYDWCYERYINQKKSMQEMADEAGCTLRTIQKWCGDIHKLNAFTFKHYKKLTDRQRDLIIAGTLGDGHIDKRDNVHMYIEQHAAGEKDYLYWKYDILKDICNKEPSYISEQVKKFNDKEYLCKSAYRIETKVLDDIADIFAMPTIEKIKLLNEFMFATHILDDGSRDNNVTALWEVCLAGWSDEEIATYIDVAKNRFGLNAKQRKDQRYVGFDKESSRKIDRIILNNIPRDLDIIKKKFHYE